MQTRSPSTLAATARPTSYAPAAAPLPEPASLLGSADRKGGNAGKRSRSASPEPGASPLARRAQPLTTALTTAWTMPWTMPLRPSEPRASRRSTPAFATATQLGTQRAGATPPAPAQSAAGQPPEGAGQAAFSDSPILAIVAAYAAREQPLAYLSGLRQVLQGESGVNEKARITLMRERPEALLEVHPRFRSEDDYRGYFEAGGSLDKLAPSPLSPAIRQMAIEAHPLDLKFIVHRSLALCQDAVARDGYALEFVPPPLLAPGSEHREKLVALAYDSPRPPRIKQVPLDLRTQARCIGSLQSAPFDLRDFPEDEITFEMCETSLDYTPREFRPNVDAIPMRLRDERMARLLLPFIREDPRFRPPARAWYRPEALTSEFRRDLLLARPEELVDRTVFRDPVPLTLIAEIVQAGGGRLKLTAHRSFSISAEQLAEVIQRSAGLEGLAGTDALSRGPWTEGLLPKDLSQRELYRWALRSVPVEAASDLPGDLAQDKELFNSVFQRTSYRALSYFDPQMILRHADLLDDRLRRNPGEVAHAIDCLRRHLGAEWLNETCRKLLHWRLPNESQVIDYVLRSRASAVLTHETRAALMAALPTTRVQALSVLTKDDADALPREQWTRAHWEAAAAADGHLYLYIPNEFENEALLMKALWDTPSILEEPQVIPVDEAFALKAMVEVGMAPGLFPEHIRNATSFREAMQELPACAYNAGALYVVHVGLEGEVPDELTVAWTDKLVQEDPRRMLDFDDWYRLDWGLLAYRKGGATLADVAQKLRGDYRPDFLAAIGPFGPGRQGPLHPQGLASQRVETRSAPAGARALG